MALLPKPPLTPLNNAQLEGLLLDQVYTGKGMQGTLGKNILFLHTGGSQGLFAYSDML
jgi:L-cysteate sulfo-lyase